MEEKVVVLAPPVILSPKERDEVETLLMEGTGEVGNAIFVNPYYMAETSWERVANVESDGSWKVLKPPVNFEYPKKDAWVRVRQEHWNGEISEPSEKVFFTKLLAPPVITKPRAGELLPQHEQMIEGTGFHLSTNIEIELTKMVPPALTYQTSVRPDRAGWWKASPGWSLMPGPYVLKCRQVFKEHTSRWSDDLLVTVE
ncbi:MULTISPECIES: hypothetical protein [unclassified Pseudomonas]|uniref:hypothetical protein n=1 Tax=unclassified Pseudomonas TaxID=196821 RepID=UPI000CD2C90A|nr:MULTISPECIES: hypothetical protein [unclassified Pseudomonas]POA28262.1 hypothetical protein C1887_24785 [Pseudomonas sp. GW456-R21]POA63651.1 hypothetical protein C1884_23740 [Pseudomonas sp. GW460-R15]